MDWNIAILMHALTEMMSLHRVKSDKLWCSNPGDEGLICKLFTCIGRKSANRPLFVALAFGNALDDCNVDEFIKSGNDISKSDINMVGFRPAAREFIRTVEYSRRRSTLVLVKLRLLGSGTASISTQFYYATIR